jgi:hypothetical protein
LAYLVPLDVDVVPIKFHQFLLGEWPAMIIFLFFNLFAFWPIPWQRQLFWNKSTLKSTTSHGIWYSYKVL